MVVFEKNKLNYVIYEYLILVPQDNNKNEHDINKL